MLIRKGQMWDYADEYDLICVTTNSEVLPTNKLIMGGGVALEARRRYPGIDLRFGLQLNELGMMSDVYGMLFDRVSKLAAFQTKQWVSQNSRVDIIRKSVGCLILWLDTHPNSLVALPYPGVGLGGLSIEEVYPVIKDLPDRVHIWQYEHGYVK